MERSFPLYPFQEKDEQGDLKNDGIVTLTGADADLIVEEMGFEHQRVADHTHIANLMTYMQDGNWIGPSLLTFAKNGDGKLHLVDGQHRLRAFGEYAHRVDLEAGENAAPTTMDFQVIVTDTHPMEAYAALDSVARTRNSGVIGEALQLNVPSQLMAKALPAAARALLYSGLDISDKIASLKQGKREKLKNVSKRVPIRLCRDYITNRVDAFAAMGRVLDSASNTERKTVARILCGARVLPVCLETLHAEPAEAEAFWTAVVTGDPDPDGLWDWQSIGDLRIALVQDDDRSKQSVRVSYRARMCAGAWNSRTKGVFKTTKSGAPGDVPVNGASYDDRQIRVKV